jgi:hypothetical protein
LIKKTDLQKNLDVLTTTSTTKPVRQTQKIVLSSFPRRKKNQSKIKRNEEETVLINYKQEVKTLFRKKKQQHTFTLKKHQT